MSRELPDLDHLRLLVGVSELGSLGAAGRAMGMAQPNATRAIRHLERQLGLALVHRTPAGSRLTTEGTVVVQWARDVLDTAEKLMHGVDALRSERSGQLDICASMTVAEYLVPRWLGEFRRRRPSVHVNLAVANSFDVIDGVRGGTVRLGFVETPAIPSGLKTAVVGHDSLVVVVAPDHAWARRRKPILPDELAATPLIVREPGSGTRITLERLLKGHALADPAMELASNAAVKISAAAGVAPAVLSDLAVASAVHSGELTSVPVEGLRLTRTLRAVWDGGLTPDANALEMLRIARASVPSRAARRQPDSRRSSPG